MSLSRAELEAMDRDQLIDTLVTLGERVDDLEARLDAECQEREQLREDMVERNKRRVDADTELRGLIGDLQDRVDDLEASTPTQDDLSDAEDRVHHERSKLTRRVAALEDDLGITASDALATAEAGQDADHLTKLGRLVRHGPETVSDRPTERMRRAKELVENWNRWGTVVDDSHNSHRRLGASEHDLKTRLEDARSESLAWKQVYRAMELVVAWSGPNVRFETDQEGDRTWVLRHDLEDGGGGA